MTASTTPVAIIGGGAAGTLLALHLAHRHGTAVTLYDGANAFGRGVAYSATSPWHRLNVPAVRMGGWHADEPDAFLVWLAAREGGAPAMQADRYVERAVYGEWLSGLLMRAVDSGYVTRVAQDVTALTQAGAGHGANVEPDARAAAGPRWRLHLANGEQHAAHAVALCQGNAAPRALPGAVGQARYLHQPWHPQALAQIHRDHTVLIAGSGASGLDSVLELLNTGHRGQIHLVSRRALLPQPDALPGPDATPLDPLAATAGPATLRALFSRVRGQLDLAWHAGEPWQPLMDAVLRQADARWAGLTLADQQRFLRHVRPYWMVFRHRADPAALARLRIAEATGQLHRIAGRIDAVTPRAQGLAPSLRVTLHRAGQHLPAIDADWVVNATGPDERIARRRDDLLSQLLQDGHARAGALGLGLDVTEAGEVRNRHGAETAGLYALGLPTRGVFWEVTSVPALRARAAPLAAVMAERASDPANAGDKEDGRQAPSPDPLPHATYPAPRPTA
ncbi:FAD/NAD(P)-binding protein [Achromobacter sp. DH1f]|uniref:FAD/NAD(P)-binding protein n=1 Tax=Achromobacter sp. DH1f TaxID=1397275 RepID=UPI000468E849|nr:FAD/NAD(P)-binding protein [Achromobacter sp. DH1f]